MSCDSPVISRRVQADPIPDARSMIHVVLVDDPAMVRQGLRTMLESYTDIQVIGEAANGDEAITLARMMQPDVVLMDINMPTVNGIEATAVIKRSFPKMAIVGLSVNADRGNREAMIQAGAATYLLKKCRLKCCIKPSKRPWRLPSYRTLAQLIYRFHNSKQTAIDIRPARSAAHHHEIEIGWSLKLVFADFLNAIDQAPTRGAVENDLRIRPTEAEIGNDIGFREPDGEALKWG